MFFNVLISGLLCGKVAQWLILCTVNHDIMGSNPVENIFLFFLEMTSHSTNVKYCIVFQMCS